MKRITLCWKCIWEAFLRIHLVDRCLILFMLVLLFQSAYSLFFHGDVLNEASNVDVIVRTSSASIFGYFLSANFIRHSSADKKANPKKAKEINKNVNSSVNVPHNRIGFSSAEQEETIQLGGAGSTENPESEYKQYMAGRLQIIAATVVGLFCLLVLLLLRNVSQWNEDILNSPTVTATVAQFRDFVSGCVGFLIGCPTNEQNQNK